MVWAARTGALPTLASQGIVVVEKSPDLGVGRLDHYDIHSDTAAQTFLECLRDARAPQLTCLLGHPAAARVAAYRNGSVPLKYAAEFLRELGLAMKATLQHHGVPVLTGQAIASHRVAGGWETEVQLPEGCVRLRSEALVLATGGVQQDDCIDGVTVGTVRLQDFRERVILSDQVLGPDGLSVLRAMLEGQTKPSVAIVGGSHSALTAAWRVLNELPEVPFGPHSVAVLHRRPLRPFYLTPEDARADGYVDFSEQDVCPVSGRLFRLAGFRFRARELLRGALGLKDAAPDHRLKLIQLTPEKAGEAELRLRKASIIVAALGYRPRALPLLNQDGSRISLGSERGPGASLVNESCEVLDDQRRPVPGVYGIGLATGFRPTGALGGEPSFSGQTNGLWLWQNGVGERIVNALLGGAEGTSRPIGEAASR